MMKYRPAAIQSAASYSFLWHLSLGCFVLAGLTGFLYRLGMLGWVPDGLALGNIRHAHSHLMFFGWAVPLPLYILMQKVIDRGEELTKGIRWMKNSIAAGLLFGILAFPAFLLYGYRPISIGTASLPLSVILSGLVMVSWYGFIYGYLQSRSRLSEDDSQLWFDGALTMLVVSSMGAWGVAVVQAIAPSSHLFMKGLTHFFLATFTEGWIVPALLAVLMTKIPLKKNDAPVPANVAIGCITIGAPLTFPYGIAESLLSPMLLAVARVGGAVAAIGLLSYLYSIFTAGQWKRTLWVWALGLLALKGIMQLASSFIPSAFWLSDHGIRIFYLHVLLLGAYTLAVTGWLHHQFRLQKGYYYLIIISIMITLFSLILPTGLWPASLSGLWIFQFLAAGALLPVLALLILWGKLANSTKDYN